jgi:D-ribose pyranase
MKAVILNFAEVVVKQGKLLNAELSGLIASMGHGQKLVIGDAGLPVPAGVPCIDLAVTGGVPAFFDVLDAVLAELRIEQMTMAEEMNQASPVVAEGIERRRQSVCAEIGRDIHVNWRSHEVFKSETADALAVVRTGEFTPYANIILHAGVVF